MEGENSLSNEQQVKRPRGKPRTALWRYDRPDGKYNDNPISPSYFRDYYKEKK